MDKLWERQDWEDDLSFRVFNIWLKLDPRDLDEAWQIHTGETYTSTGKLVKAPWHIKNAAEGKNAVLQERGLKITWEDRARAFDIEVQRKEHSQWLDRRRKIRANEYELSELLQKKAREMLDWPIYAEEEEVVDDKTVIKRLPSKWALRDVQGMVKISSELARLAAEMEQSILKFTISFSPETLEAIEVLKRYGIDASDVVGQIEQLIQNAARKYQEQDPI